MRPAENIERLISKLRVEPRPEASERTVADALAAQKKSRLTGSAPSQPTFWRIIMKNPITKLAVAAVVVVALSVGLQVFDATRATAAEVFAQAVKAMTNLRSVHIKAQMRTLPHDNFELILLDKDFVPVEMWKEFGTGEGRWRVEKPGRVIVMDGQGSLMLIRPTNIAVRSGVRTGLVHWLKPLLDVHKVLDSEIQLAQQEQSELLLSHEKDADGRDKLVVTVEALAQGDFTNDWLRNTSVTQSDNCRVYRFDAGTKLLEDLRVYVHTDDSDENDVLVFEITDIEYNIDLDPQIFALELPDDVIWFEEPKVLPDEKYQEMGPKEMVTAFLQACADEDWEEAAKFWKTGIADERIRDAMGGLEIIDIGEPFQSGLYRWWFVPYEVKYKSGRVFKFNMSVRNDNPAKRYVVDGGIGGF